MTGPFFRKGTWEKDVQGIKNEHLRRRERDVFYVLLWLFLQFLFDFVEVITGSIPVISPKQTEQLKQI